MPIITFKQVTLDTSSEDGDGRLVFADDILVAVLVQLAAERAGVAKPGDWFLEVGFGACSGAGEIFGSLDEARAWVLQQTGRGRSPPLRTRTRGEKSAKPVRKKRPRARALKARFGAVEERQEKPQTTLGDLLGRKGSGRERDWAKLVQSIAAGDQAALHALYERTHGLVLTLAERITAERDAAEEVTRDVFHTIWQHASRYDAANGTVLAWVMNQSRARAIDRVRRGAQKKHASGIVELRQLSQTLGVRWSEPEWEQVAPGIECKRLATDTKRHRISMLVRLAPGASYPAHTHASNEELHLLDGELWIDGRKLLPGDYNHGAPGATDDCVSTETGCTCVLVTSTKDVLRLQRKG